MKILVILLGIFASTNAKHLFYSNFLDSYRDAPADNQINIVSVNKVSDFEEENPTADMEILKMRSDYRGEIYYHAGARQSGDRLVGTGTANLKWSTLRNVVIQVKYPRSGVGALITYISCDVSQSSNLGRGYMTSGGIHQRSITFVIEAYLTTFVNMVCNIYGI